MREPSVFEWLLLATVVATAALLLLRPMGRFRIPLLLALPIPIATIALGVLNGGVRISYLLIAFLPLLFLVRERKNDRRVTSTAVRCMFMPIAAASAFALFATLYLRSVTTWRGVGEMSSGELPLATSLLSAPFLIPLFVLPLCFLLLQYFATHSRRSGVGGKQ